MIYRAYEGLADIRLPLTYRVGRPNLSGEDLVKLAHAGRCFRPVCCYAPQFTSDLVYDAASLPIVAQALGIR